MTCLTKWRRAGQAQGDENRGCTVAFADAIVSHMHPRYAHDQGQYKQLHLQVGVVMS